VNGVEISLVCPRCGDTWSMSIPHGKRTVRIPCRRCGHQSDHTVATVMTDEGWLSTLAERERLRARTIRTLRIALWINAGAALLCVVVAFMAQTWAPVSGVWTNLIAHVLGRSTLKTVRNKEDNDANGTGQV